MIGYEYDVIPTPLQRINVVVMKPTNSVGRILLKKCHRKEKVVALFAVLTRHKAELRQNGQSEERNNRN